MLKMIDQTKLEKFSFESFQKRWPFPWFEFDQFLTPEAFFKLYDEFPSLEFFQYHQGLARYDGQRSHDRYYLSYESSIYKPDMKGVFSEKGQGKIKRDDLNESWKTFMDELEGPIYKDFIQKVLGNQNFHIRYAWHIGKSTNEVSPHRDESMKAGTHIFYFNTKEDWDPSWGGSLLVLGGKLVPEPNPDFDDFAVSIPVKNMDNHSFLFKNNANAWHGVKALTCPEGKYRKLFNVIFEENQ